MTGLLEPRVASPIPAELPAAARVREAYRRIAIADRPEVWITLRPESEVLADAAVVERRMAAGERMPLGGWLVAVKDNIDVAGLPTTAGCPEFAAIPAESATAVHRLVEAGALVLGKTNLDQFATGLVGTRSPYGAVRCAWDPALISGGSSSGSAVAVALGLVDLGIGTDTAGSGRVPAAFQGIVGVKASLGIVPTTGVVPACADYDCVTVLAADLTTARAAIAVLAGPDPADPRSRCWPDDVMLAAPAAPRVAVPRPADLTALEPAYRVAFDAAVRQLVAAGAEVGVVDISGLLAAAELLYDGAIVAERFAAVGRFLATEPASADPTVAGIVLGAERVCGHALVTDLERLLVAKSAAATLLDGFDGLLLPTTTEQPTIAAVQADPLGINRRLGTFTNFCNLLDMAAVAVPGPPAGEAPFGVMVVVPAFHDQVALDLAALFLGQDPGAAVVTGGIELAVFGAHLRGQPLNGELCRLGARFVGRLATSGAYRMITLATEPAKPGLIRVRPGAGRPIAGERWLLSRAALGRLLADLPAPMSLTKVELADGSWITGFGCAHQAALDGTDITAFGGWTAYLRAGS